MTITKEVVELRFWKLKESNRVIAAYCQMAPRWVEITKEEYERIKEWKSTDILS